MRLDYIKTILDVINGCNENLLDQVRNAPTFSYQRAREIQNDLRRLEEIHSRLNHDDLNSVSKRYWDHFIENINYIRIHVYEDAIQDVAEDFIVDYSDEDPDEVRKFLDNAVEQLSTNPHQYLQMMIDIDKSLKKHTDTKEQQELGEV